MNCPHCGVHIDEDAFVDLNPMINTNILADDLAVYKKLDVAAGVLIADFEERLRELEAEIKELKQNTN